MKKNDALKRAGCVLLAAQMTVSVLPMDSMAAYVGDSGRSGAILRAASIDTNRHVITHDSLLLDKGRMPQLIIRRFVNRNSKNATVLEDAAGGTEPALTSLDSINVDIETSPVDPNALSGETPSVTPDDSGGEVPSVDPDDSGGEVPSVTPDDSGGETPSVTPDDSGGETPPVTPDDSGGETPPVDPDTPGGETPPVDPDTPGGETPPVDPDAPGSETPSVDPDAPGSETPPVDPDAPGSETPPVDPDIPGGETPSVDPDIPGGELPIGPVVTPEPPVEVKVMTDQASLRASSVISGNLNLFGYSYWASPTGREHAVETGIEGRYGPYLIESTEAQPGGMNNSGYALRPSGYAILNNNGTIMTAAKIRELSNLKLGRIPDMKFEGWCFAQSNPAPDRPGGSVTENERVWVSRFHQEAESDPFVADLDEIIAHADPALTIGSQYTANVVAKWVDSDRADLTALTLYGWPKDKSAESDREVLELYEYDFTQPGQMQKDQTAIQLRAHDTGGDFADEYYVQVPVDIDRLTLDFTTYEPGTMIKITGDTIPVDAPILYRYDREDYIWTFPGGSASATISAEEYGKRNTALPGTSPLLREQPGRRVKFLLSDEDNPTNSVTNPARALWSLPETAAIPLEFTAPDKVYTDITITVVAPDGTMDGDGNVGGTIEGRAGTTATYTLHVRRMDDPKLTLNPGNTPYGVLEADSNVADKEAAQNRFDRERELPYGLWDHNQGGVYKGVYSTQAWPAEKDYDTDRAALVVYQDADFEDPGLQLIDSQGQEVASENLKRSIRLRQVTELTTGHIQNGMGSWTYYQSGSLVPDTGTLVEMNVASGGGKDHLTLKGQYVLPGIYSMEYSYYDPASDVTYNSTDLSVYNREERAADFSRPLIVLPKPGDIDMDGMITLADAIALEELLSDTNSFLHVDNNDPVQHLFQYRVCDVDGDGTVTPADVDKLKSGYVSHVVDKTSSDLFYLNFGDSGEPERKTLTTEPTATGKAELSVKYLGKNIDGVPTGVVNDGEVEIGDIFWVGVKLENAAALAPVSNSLKGFEFTLVYDKNLLQPGLPQGYSQWESIVEEANLSMASATVWQDAYTLVGNSGPNGSLIDYPGLAVPTVREGRERELATYTVALQLTGQTPASLSDGYLLYIPFQMYAHPIGVEHDKVAMIEPAMGGREFSMVTTGGTVSAWSSQDTIFGGSTQALKTYLAYTGSDMIPVGEDKTECITLYDDTTHGNARYGEPFSTTGVYNSTGESIEGDLASASQIVGTLPAGMEYSPAGLGSIFTSDAALGATKAGSYRFYINGVLYEIVVDKAPLTLTVDSTNARYYGEANTASTDIHFTYERTELKKADLDRAAVKGLTNSGQESSLVAILEDDGYKRPEVTTIDANGMELTPKTPVGDYTAKLTGGSSTNYSFRYMRRGETTSNDKESTANYRVIPRPIRIGIPVGPVATLESKPKDESNTRLLTAQNGSGATNFTADWPTGRQPDGSINGIQLTGVPIVDGDTVTISYTGHFRPIEGKDISSTEYVLDPGNVSEPRDVEITDVALTGANKDNYRIADDSDILVQGAKTTGTVIREPITKIEIPGNGPETSYNYGQQLSLEGASRVILTWENGYSEPAVFGPNYNPRGISLSWVEKSGDAPSTGIEAAAGEYLQVKKHNGKYLCIYVNNGTGIDPACVWVGPYTVNKAELTLTIANESRYYGEENTERRSVTFSRDQLSAQDKLKISSNTIEAIQDGKLDGFANLNVSYRETAAVDGKTVTSKTNAGSYFVVISGATADNYNITYTQPGAATASKDFGYATLTIDRRPIQINRITGKAGLLYDDATSNVLTRVRGTAPKATGQSFEFDVARPTQSYYTAGGANNAVPLGTLTGDAILEGDSLTFTYRATFDTDKQNAPFYDVNSWTTDTKEYGVTVAQLQLDSSVGSGRNYQLVSTTGEKAYNGLPEQGDRIEKGGDVAIRRIVKLEIGKIPDFMGDYHYGDGLQVDGQLMVRVYYGLEDGTVTGSKDILYYTPRGPGADLTSAPTVDFDANGLRLEWADENGNAVENGLGDIAYNNQVMTVADHNGRHLVVRGRRLAGHKEVTTVVNVPVTVVKKTIKVQAADITRVYGEENLIPGRTTYQALVDWNDALIQRDKDILIAAGYDDFDGKKTPYNRNDDVDIRSAVLGEAAVSPALLVLDPTYVGPMFLTPANNKVDVGRYALTMSGGKMANYEFELVPGEVEVKKRRIQLEELLFRDPIRNPLATMVAGSDVRIINNVTATNSPSWQEAEFTSITAPGTYQSDVAVLPNDTVTVSMTVAFGFDSGGNPIIPTLPAGEVTAKAWVKVSDVAIVGDGGKNYELANNALNGGSLIEQGRIDGRQIDYIVLSDPTTPKLNYEYGESLDLSGMRVDIYYKNVSGESTLYVDRNVSITNRGGISVHYLADPTVVNDPRNYAGIANGEFGKLALQGDHLTHAQDALGFAHHGKYLVISVKERNPAQPDPSQPDAYLYPTPIAVSATRPIQITPKLLQYTLRANDKVYDGTTVGSGTAWVEINQIYKDKDGNSDVVFIHNGTRYDNMEMPQEGGSYRFDSGSYGTGITFTFADPNVAYEQTPGHDNYGPLTVIPVGVSGITLSGKDADNYTIIQSVASSAPNAPTATITRAERTAPDVAALTTMSTDIHTNTVTITVDGKAVDYGDSKDIIYNNELHFEYALEYLYDETDPTRGFAAAIEGGDSPFFGGEKVVETGEEFEPAEGEESTLTPGMGQSGVQGDQDFGEREPLPRDTYFRAKVRLAQTHNYNASDYTPSIAGTGASAAAEMAAAVAAARAAEEPDEIPNISYQPEEVEPPRPIPVGQSLGKTYQYRFDIVAAQTMRGTDGEEHVLTQLDSVWFADRATYPTEDYLNALTTGAEAPRYHNYSWAPKGNPRVSFPINMSEEIKANIPQPEGSTQETIVNQNATAKLYVSLVPRKGGGMFFNVEILSENLVAMLGDEPVRLEARVTPSSGGKVGWRSSDTTVVTIDEDGELSFVGVGAATVTAVYAEATDSIRVTVLPGKEVLPEGFFNAEYLDAFMELTDDLMFYPERTLSRGELAIILAKFLYPTIVIEEDDRVGYVDIDDTQSCAHAVEILSSLGILAGVGNNRFAPDQKATRAEMAAILVRLGALPAADPTSQSFVDSGPEDTWAWAEIEALVKPGITQGTGDSCFSPHRLLTRAETAAFLTRMLHYKLDLSQEGLRYPIDVEESYWAWKEILQAVNGTKKPVQSEE